jgi:hypothetical protein
MVLWATPYTFGARRVILGEYYYPKTGNSWIRTDGKTVFEPGDTIIFKDDRVTLGFGSVSGTVGYQLDNKNATIVEVSISAEAAKEFVNCTATGSGAPVGIFEGFAMPVYISPNAGNGSLGAKFVYLDNEKRGLGGYTIAQQLLDIIEAFDLAQVERKAITTPPATNLLVTSPETVLANKTFTLTANLDAVSYSWQQTTTGPALTGPAIQQGNPPANAKVVSFLAPGLKDGYNAGTLTFRVQATMENNVKSNIFEKTVTVIKEAAAPPGSVSGGTQFGTPPTGKGPAQARVLLPPGPILVNTPFRLSAFASDAYGPVCNPTIVPCPQPPTTTLEVKWERVVNSVPQAPALTTDLIQGVLLSEERECAVDVTEAAAGSYTYRFTVATNSGSYGNYYTVTLNVTTPQLPPPTGPAISLATPLPDNVEPDSFVTLDASGTTGKAPLVYKWSVKYDNRDVVFTEDGKGKLTFRVPVEAASKKITIALIVEDKDKIASNQSLEINVKAITIRALNLPQIRGLLTNRTKTASEVSDYYGIQAPDFINYIAVMNPAGEPGKKELISIRSLDSEGSALSDFYKSVELGPGGVPLTKALEKVIPEEALTDSQTVKVNALSRLVGLGMVIDGNTPRMDAFDLNSKTGSDWVLPYLFKPPRESFGVLSFQNASTDNAEVQAEYFPRAGNFTLKGQKVTLKPGGSKTIELIDFFGLRQLNDLQGYVALTSNKPLQVLGLYGDNREMFAIPGFRREDFASTLVAPVAFRDNEWETVLSVINGDTTDRAIKVQLLNADLPATLKEKSWTLKPGINETTLTELFGNVLIPFTAVRLTNTSGVAGSGFGGTVLLRNVATGADTLWPMIGADQTLDKAIYSHIAQGGDWQSSFVISNVGSAAASLKVSGMLVVRDTATTFKNKSVQGTFTIPTGGIVAGPELSKLGISHQGEIFGGYLLIEGANPTATINLLATGLLFHNNGKGAINGLSLVPAVK